MMRLTKAAAVAVVLGMTAIVPTEADAALILNTSNDTCSAPGPPAGYSQDLDFLEGEPDPGNGCGLDTTGFALLYKNNQGGTPEEGGFAGNYTTSYFNTPTDPEDALVEWDGPAFISCGTCWLIAKDGAANPGWYGWDLEALGWDGQTDIDIQDLFVGRGAISHVSIWGIPGTPEDPEEPGEEEQTPSPEPATIALFGLALVGAAYRQRRRRG